MCDFQGWFSIHRTLSSKALENMVPQQQPKTQAGLGEKTNSIKGVAKLSEDDVVDMLWHAFSYSSDTVTSEKIK